MIFLLGACVRAFFIRGKGREPRPAPARVPDAAQRERIHQRLPDLRTRVREAVRR